MRMELNGHSDSRNNKRGAVQSNSIQTKYAVKVGFSTHRSVFFFAIRGYFKGF